MLDKVVLGVSGLGGEPLEIMPRRVSVGYRHIESHHSINGNHGQTCGGHLRGPLR